MFSLNRSYLVLLCHMPPSVVYLAAPTHIVISSRDSSITVQNAKLVPMVVVCAAGRSGTFSVSMLNPVVNHNAVCLAASMTLDYYFVSSSFSLSFSYWWSESCNFCQGFERTPQEAAVASGFSTIAWGFPSQSWSEAKNEGENNEAEELWGTWGRRLTENPVERVVQEQEWFSLQFFRSMWRYQMQSSLCISPPEDFSNLTNCVNNLGKRQPDWRNIWGFH